MWNKIRITAMVATLLTGTAAIAYSQSSSTIGAGGSAAGTGTRSGTSSTLGTGGSTAGERERSGSSTGTTLGTGGSSARMSQDMDHNKMRGRGHHRRHHGNHD